MRNITINLPDMYVKALDELGQKRSVSRSELLRMAIRDHLTSDLTFYSDILESHPEIKKEYIKKLELQKQQDQQKQLKLQKLRELREQYELQRRKRIKKERISKFYNFCILCDKELHTDQIENYYQFKKYDIFEMKFCCRCYEKYESKSLNELPEAVIKKIQKKLKKFKSFNRKS